MQVSFKLRKMEAWFWVFSGSRLEVGQGHWQVEGQLCKDIKLPFFNITMNYFCLLFSASFACMWFWLGVWMILSQYAWITPLFFYWIISVFNAWTAFLFNDWDGKGHILMVSTTTQIIYLHIAILIMLLHVLANAVPRSRS